MVIQMNDRTLLIEGVRDDIQLTLDEARAVFYKIQELFYEEDVRSVVEGRLEDETASSTERNALHTLLNSEEDMYFVASDVSCKLDDDTPYWECYWDDIEDAIGYYLGKINKKEAN